MLKLSDLLKDTFRGEIVGLVDNIVTGVLKGLQERITTLEESNQNLLATNKSLTARVAVLESQADQAEQYSRRNCLRISGIPEETGENTDNIVLRIANDIESDVRPQDIDRSHRVGNPKRHITGRHHKWVYCIIVKGNFDKGPCTLCACTN